MNIQGILNETAKAAGGTFVRDGVYSGVGALASGGNAIKFAYSLLPEPASLPNDGLIHISWWDGMEVEGGDAGDLTVYRHRIRLQLMYSITRSQLPEAHALLTPFLPLYRDRFAAASGGRGGVTLGGLATGGSFIESSSGIIEALYPGRLALEFILRVRETESVTYTA